MDSKGTPESDSELRTYEYIPLTGNISEYINQEVLPHVPDAWVDEEKTRIGYEIIMNRYFYKYTPPRPLTIIEEDLRKIEGEISELVKRLTE